jgi:hypothetical protein
MTIFRKKHKTSRELWKSVLEKTEKEICTGRYKVRFSSVEVFYFPKTPKIQILKSTFFLPLYLKLKNQKRRFEAKQLLSNKISFLTLCLLSHGSVAATLPKGISSDELSTLIQTLGMGNATRVMRSAEAYPTLPGLKISLETALVPSGSLNELGNNSASLPILIPSPKINITKGLGMGFEASLNISTESILETMGTVGFLAKWTYLEEKDDFATSALFLSFTRLTGFKENYKGNDFEFGVLASKDFVRLKPFVGLGLLLANATVTKTVSPKTQTGTVLRPHLFVGTEIELPMNITFQMDFAGLTPSGSFSLGYQF